MNEEQRLTFAETEDLSTPEAPYSSNVAELEYFEGDGQLLATFKGGARYQYTGIQWSVWIQLKAERNRIGIALNRLVIKGPYPFRKLLPGEASEAPTLPLEDAPPIPPPTYHQGAPQASRRSTSERRRTR